MPTITISHIIDHRLRGDFLYTAWMSAIDKTWKTDYKQLLVDSRDSFKLQ